MYLVRRGLYLDPSGTGCVILARHRPALDAGLAIGAALAVSMISGFVLGGLPAGPVADALGWASAALGWWVLIACLILIVSTPGSLASVVGPEAPRRNLHSVMGLSQLPGTRLTALVLARRAVSALPPGTVVAVAAATDELAEAYLRLGFTRGRKRRLNLIVGERPAPTAQPGGRRPAP